LEVLCQLKRFTIYHSTKKNRIIDAILDELGLHTYEHINIQNIIKTASIPRGSFYQYFKDKDDLFAFFYDFATDIKLKYWGDLLSPTLEISFLERLKKIYLIGYKFSVDYPKIVKIGYRISESQIIKNDENFKKGTQVAIDLYENFIKADQNKGLIRKDIDARILSSFITEFIQKVTLEELLNERFDFNIIETKVNQLIDIIEKGIK
jgi:AcrR family transcriptional regulator